VICDIAGAVIAVVAVFFLRELSPSLRDQVMVDAGTPSCSSVAPSAVRCQSTRSACARSAPLLATRFGYSESRANGLVAW
jgi:hypothetical protein